MDKTLFPGIVAATAMAWLATGSAYAELPQHEFACQVQTIAGKPGLVVIQANQLDEAIRIAGSAMAVELGGTRHATATVTECIVRPEQKFRDSRFQRFYQGVPR